ncbi:hypothetical protein [Antarcticimicrobium sediminis]|nr:hypothetical protein [Antarcticimicrobium sediminis]
MGLLLPVDLAARGFSGGAAKDKAMRARRFSGPDHVFSDAVNGPLM